MSQALLCFLLKSLQLGEWCFNRRSLRNHAGEFFPDSLLLLADLLDRGEQDGGFVAAVLQRDRLLRCIHPPKQVGNPTLRIGAREVGCRIVALFLFRLQLSYILAHSPQLCREGLAHLALLQHALVSP